MESLKWKLIDVVANVLPESEAITKLIEEGLVSDIVDRVIETIIAHIEEEK